MDLPEDLNDVEVIYLDDDEWPEEDDGEEEEMMEDPRDLVVEDLAKLTFSKHQKSVFCCDLSKDGTLAVTGGEDDSAYIWSVATGDVILECTGHKDSITATQFNHDAQWVATGDMGGMIQVWSVKDEKLVWCYEGDDLEWLRWHPVANVLISGSQSGDIYVWQVPQGNCKVLPSHGPPCTCGQVLPDGKRLVAGYSDGQVKLWDIKSSSVVWTFTNQDETACTSLEICNEGALLSVAPTSNLLKLADGKLLSTLLIEGETEIEAHSFNSALNILVTGSLSGQLCVWDLSKQAIRHQAAVECAVTVMKMGTNGRVYMGATDGAVYVCDVRTGLLVETFTGQKTDILSLCISSDGETILATSDDNTAKIFKNSK